VGDSAEDQPFSVPDGIAKLHLVLTAGEEDDYDVELYYNRRGSLEEVATSAEGAGTPEEITVTYPEPGEYVLRVVNYTASSPWTAKVEQFRGRFVREDTGVREAWTLSCEIGGRVVNSRRVVVDRGGTARVGQVC
jgi:hypothetical protein